MTNTSNKKLSRPNILKNQKILYDNYISLDINTQNNVSVISNHIEAQNNIITTPSHISQTS